MHISFKSALLFFSLMITLESACTSTEFISSLNNHIAVKIGKSVLSTSIDLGLLGLGSIFHCISITETEAGGKSFFGLITVFTLGLLYLKKSYDLERAAKALHTPTENQTEKLPKKRITA